MPDMSILHARRRVGRVSGIFRALRPEKPGNDFPPDPRRLTVTPAPGAQARRRDRGVSGGMISPDRGGGGRAPTSSAPPFAPEVRP